MAGDGTFRPRSAGRIRTGAHILAVAMMCAIATSLVDAQRGRGGGRGRGAGPPAPAQQAAPVDLTGYWVSVVTEDWRWRMLTPAPGDFAGVPLSPAGRAIGQAWNPAADAAAGQQCRAYGAAAIMREPGRLRITWQDDQTLAIETDAGGQRRLLMFGATPPPGAAPSWQGTSMARWEGVMRGPGQPDFAPIALNPRVGTGGRALEVVTTNLLPGYLRKNGAPYSARTTVREYFDVFMVDDTPWFTVTTIVEDPEYLTTPFVTSSNFKKQPDATGWTPSAC
jgi:hypothetical protein